MSMYKTKLLHFLFSLFNICKLRASDMILLIPPSLCASNKRRHIKKEKEREICDFKVFVNAKAVFVRTF